MNADELKGEQALTEFFNYSVRNYSGTFNYASYDEFYRAVTAVKGCKFLREGLGLSINSNNMSDSKWKTAMRSLADQGGGRLPSTMMGWFNALQGEAAKVNFLEATQFVVVESAKDIAMGAKEIGDAVIDTGKTLLVIGPILVVAAVVFIGWQKVKSV